MKWLWVWYYSITIMGDNLINKSLINWWGSIHIKPLESLIIKDVTRIHRLKKWINKTSISENRQKISKKPKICPFDLKKGLY